MRPNKLYVVLGMAALLLLSLYAGKAGISDLELRIAQGHLDAWSREMRVPGWDEWVRVKGHLWRGHRLDPANPDLLNELGRLQELRAVDKTAGKKHVLESWAEALGYYRKAADLRPTWPHTWASVATVKLKLLQLDSEFLIALARATQFGPWEPSVQIRVVEVGFAAWAVLPDHTRTVVMSTAERALTREGLEIIRLAHRYGRDCDVYPLVVGDDRLEALLTELPDCHQC